MAKNMLEDYLRYCETDRQKQCITYHIHGESNCGIARYLGVNESTVRRIIKRIKERAALGGYAPKNGMTHEVPSPFMVKGVSTLYDKNGEIAGQWVKTTVNNERVKEMVKELCVEYMHSIPKYEPVQTPRIYKKGYAKKLVVYPIADAHIGMLSWHPETGNDYDAEIAENTIRNTITTLIDNSEPCEACLIENLGDWLHVDNQFGRTERGGNNLDMDGRYAKLLQCGIRILRYCIEYAVQKHKHVYVTNCMGNHDDIGSLWLTAAIKNIYENEKRITVNDSPSPRHYFHYYNSLIGASHGYDVKNNMLPIVMATEKAQLWGETKFHYWHVGHIHQDRLVEVGDCKVESFRAVCAKDAWSNANGYMSGRDIKAIFFDREHGEIARHTVRIL